MTVRELQTEVRGEVVLLRGELNAGAQAALDAGFEQAAGAGTGAVVLDFSATEYINSTGIALIVGLLARARAAGLEVRARGLSDHYREIFTITRLADFMTMEEGGAGD